MDNLALQKNLSSLLGQKGFVNAEESLSWQRDWLDQYGEIPFGVALPKSTKEVSEVLSFCHAEGLPIVPQGGNTGLVGAGVVCESRGLIMSLNRMNKISVPDLYSGNVLIESGVILENLHKFLKGTGSMFPMHLGSEGSTQFGGLIATNAGGSHAFRFGMMHDLVLGLEVVLADGSIWNGLRSVQKDNTSYLLRKLFCGSEGTLGVITKAIVKLSPEPKQKLTAILAVRNSSGLVKLAKKLREEGNEFLTAMEFFSEVGLEIALENIPNLVFPLKSRTSFYLLLEATSCSDQVPLESILISIISWGMDRNIIADGSLAMSDKQRLDFWRLREEQPEGQRRLGPQLKHDISVPPSKIKEFLDIAEKECNKILKDVIINPFGHLGDGNIHYNISPPKGEANFSDLDNEFALKLAHLASSMGGSFAAEHGIGRAKIDLANTFLDPVEKDLVRRVKKSFDESGQLNPGVLICP